MKPLYQQADIPQTWSPEAGDALGIYLEMFTNHREDVEKLKWHEKHFMFSKMQHQDFFWRKMADWKEVLESGKGEYVTILSSAYKEKREELQKQYNRKSINRQQFIQRDIYMRATFFHAYYLTRMYFDEKKDKYVSQDINGNTVYADIYTYIHVLTRHYFPVMNQQIGGSLNGDIACLDIKKLPESLLKIVEQYSSVSPLHFNTNRLLFEIEGDKYILWLKNSGLSRNLPNGMQIRSFYKCTEQGDLEKFVGLSCIKVTETISVYV